MAYAKDVDVMNKRVTLLLDITSRKKMMQKRWTKEGRSNKEAYQVSMMMNAKKFKK
jgi:hypothetical protein